MYSYFPFLEICMILLFIGAVILVNAIFSFLALKLVNKKYPNAELSVFDVSKFGIIADMVAIVSVAIFLCVQNLALTNYSFESIFLLFLWLFSTVTFYPDYSQIFSDGNYSTLITIVIAFAISLVLRVIFEYVFVLRKTKLDKKDKISSLIIILLITAPYLLFI